MNDQNETGNRNNNDDHQDDDDDEGSASLGVNDVRKQTMKRGVCNLR